MKLIKVGIFWINPDRVNAVVLDINRPEVVIIDVGSKDILYYVVNRTVEEVVALLNGEEEKKQDKIG